MRILEDKYQVHAFVKSIIYLGVLLAWMPNKVCAQPQMPITQAKTELKQARTDTARCRLLCELGYSYSVVNVDSSLYYLNQSLAIARRIHHKTGEARALHQLGRTYLYYVKDDSRAITCLNQAITIAKLNKDFIGLSHAYHLLAVESNNQGIGNADELRDKALYYAQQAKYWPVQVHVYSTRFEANLHKKSFAYLEDNIQKAIAISRPYDPDAWLTCSLDYCQLLVKAGKLQQVQTIARQLYAARATFRKAYGERVHNVNMARLYTHLNDYGQAEATMLASIAAEKKRPHPDTTYLYHYTRTLLSTYLSQQKYEQAYQTRDSLARLQLWLQRKRQTRDAQLQMTQQQAAFDLEKKQDELNQQRIYLMAAIIVAFLLAGFMVILARNRQRIENQRQELSVLNDNLARLNTDLTQLNATKNKLFAMLAHDLRAPVKNLSGYLNLHNWGMLSKEEFDTSARDLRNRLGYVQTVLDNMLNWVLSQMDGFKASPRLVDIAPLIQAEIEVLSPQAEQKGIAIMVDIPSDCQLLIDPNHLAIIVRNLVHNAIKFTPMGGQISIRCRMSERQTQVLISDTGIGIARLDNLFKLDKKATRGTANEQGTGLGLVLVRELIEANGGKVSVVSLPGKGSTFMLTFASVSTQRIQSIQVEDEAVLA